MSWPTALVGGSLFAAPRVFASSLSENRRGLARFCAVFGANCA
jgi:hypothetical protein